MPGGIQITLPSQCRITVLSPTIPCGSRLAVDANQYVVGDRGGVWKRMRLCRIRFQITG